MNIIKLKDHPSNLDSAARLVTADRNDPGIYQVTGGFVACLGDGDCFDGLFPTRSDAGAAIAEQLRDNKEPSP